MSSSKKVFCVVSSGRASSGGSSGLSGVKGCILFDYHGVMVSLIVFLG